MSISDQIHTRIQEFARELEQLVRQAALAAVTESLGGAAAPRAARAAVSSAATVAPARKSTKSGGKRDPKVIAGLVVRVGAHVKARPGQGVEAIAKGLNVSTHDITLPITKLLASKTIKKKGQKRATKYYPA
jgi:hypothetical protein